MGNRKQWCGDSVGRNQVKGSCPRVSPGPDDGSSVPPTLRTQPGCHLPTTPWPPFTFLALSQRSRNSDGARFPGPCA